MYIAMCLSFAVLGYILMLFPWQMQNFSFLEEVQKGIANDKGGLTNKKLQVG